MRGAQSARKWLNLNLRAHRARRMTRRGDIRRPSKTEVRNWTATQTRPDRHASFRASARVKDTASDPAARTCAHGKTPSTKAQKHIKRTRSRSRACAHNWFLTHTSNKFCLLAFRLIAPKGATYAVRPSRGISMRSDHPTCGADPSP